MIVIEHNLDVIKSADRIIDLGPEGGDEGGRMIAQGTPEQVAQVEGSYTGQFLAEMLPVRASRKAPAKRRTAAKVNGNGNRASAKSTGVAASKNGAAAKNGTGNGGAPKKAASRSRSRSAAKGL